ncbi:CBS domain-containing protein [Deinococcus sonorensis]|uniref:CBS domain-containing protein n=2 Tax=Deinococcus sonorensis TaxID=309891 RepID=A0AAU7UCE2_9DEIO
MPTIKEIMTGDLIRIEPEATLQEAADLMRAEDVGFLLVMKEQKLHGLITDRDIVVRAVAYGRDSGSEVRDFMTEHPLTLDGDTDVEEAARAMAQRRVRRLVVTHVGGVVGVVSLADLALKADAQAQQAALEGVSKPGGNN